MTSFFFDELESFKVFKKERLLALLRKANFSKEENDDKLIQEYEKALSVSDIGYRLIVGGKGPSLAKKTED